MKRLIRRHLSNMAGWRTSRKILVIESDDWGSARIPGSDVFRKMKEVGLSLRDSDQERYLKYDMLASTEDMEGLFGVLRSVRDSHGRPAVFTALSIMANPDFEKIRQHEFREYFHEPFTHSLERIDGHQEVLKLWKEGIASGLFSPQFHGREHLNVSSWLRALQAGETDTMTAFGMGLYGFTPHKPLNHVNYQDAFDIKDLI